MRLERTGSTEIPEEVGGRRERRHGARIEGLTLSSAERSTQAEQAGQGRPPSPRATLWEENRGLTPILQAICRVAGLELRTVATAAELLHAAAQAGAGDLLLLDCSLALETAMARCVAIVTQTARPLYLIHPRAETIDAVKHVALGPVIGLQADLCGLALVEYLRLQVAVATHAAARELPADQMQTHLESPMDAQREGPMDAQREGLTVTLTQREYEVLHLVGDGLPYERIASQLYISSSTVKTHAAHIRLKMGLTSRADLGAVYRRLTVPGVPTLPGAASGDTLCQAHKPACHTAE